MKQNLVNFCLFIPSSTDEEITAANLDKFLYDSNSIQVLQNSCAKSKCNLEFEMKSRSPNNGKSTKTIISGDRLQSESDEDSSSANNNELGGIK